MKNIGVILAGGKGVRLGRELPKQLIKLGDKTIIEHTIEVFQYCDAIDEIVIVSNVDFIAVIEAIVRNGKYDKVQHVLSGGKERSDSSLAAIRAYSDASDNYKMIFHDAVRPFVTSTILENVIAALDNVNAVNVAVAATDTIIEVTSNNYILKGLNRDRLRCAQTPQAFRLKTIKDAYTRALSDKNFKATDDCGVVLQYLPNESILVLEGSPENIKITYELDMLLAEKLLQKRSG